jgi:hypothetical protein
MPLADMSGMRLPACRYRLQVTPSTHHTSLQRVGINCKQSLEPQPVGPPLTAWASTSAPQAVAVASSRCVAARMGCCWHCCSGGGVRACTSLTQGPCEKQIDLVTPLTTCISPTCSMTCSAGTPVCIPDHCLHVSMPFCLCISPNCG